MESEAARMDGFEQALAADPQSPAARNGEREAAIAAALSARQEGRPEQALALLLRARRWLGPDAVLLLDTGVLEEQMKLWKDAEAALRQAQAADPANLKARYALARVEMDLGQTEASAGEWRAYLALCPGDASAHFGYGLLLEETGETDAAAAEFERSVALRPAQVESYYRLGKIRSEAGKTDQAAVLYGEALARDPKHAGALTGLGVLAFQAKHYDEAERDLGQAVLNAPGFQTARYYHGLALRRLGRPEEAAAELKLAAELAEQANRDSASKGRELAAAP